ncbi:MAG TPA: aminotransferase class V-fold PLP-dependent enzyme [Acidimicrobiia bacterium]|jgi:selenocysteine lyase/cysteine desulfurase|nr:aminotransferase class V-fold PLP-dependent enzyme [Acidimicrobiia bacterium]
MIDVERARAVTPGAADRIHLNNAGAALMTQGVLDATIGHLRLEAEIGGYEAADAAADRFDAVYTSVARLIGASRSEIAIVDNATAAWDLAFGSIQFDKGDTILTSEAEYATNYIMYLKTMRDRGVRVEVIPSDHTGQLDVRALERMINGSTRLISVTHVPTNGGLVNPAAEIGAVARAAGVPYLLDACQSVGQLQVDVGEIGCDFLSATGRKFLRAPRGTGFLFVRQDLLEDAEPPFVDMHGATWVERERYQLRPDARRYETWEFNYAAVLGMGVAIDEALEWGMADIEERVTHLGAALRGKLEDAGFEVFDIGARKCAIVTTAVPGRGAEEARRLLFDKGVNVSVTGASSTRIDAEKRGLPEMLRLSPHYYNTDEELDQAVATLVSIRP